MHLRLDDARRLLSKELSSGRKISEQMEARLQTARDILAFEGDDQALIDHVFSGAPPSFVAEFMTSRPGSAKATERAEVLRGRVERLTELRRELESRFASWLDVPLKEGLPTADVTHFPVAALTTKLIQGKAPALVTGVLLKAPEILIRPNYVLRTIDGERSFASSSAVALRVHLPGGSQEDFRRRFDAWTPMDQETWVRLQRPGHQVALLYRGLLDVDPERTDVFSGTILPARRGGGFRIRDDDGQIWTLPRRDHLAEVRVPPKA
jgi:hypothetical protein